MFNEKKFKEIHIFISPSYHITQLKCLQNYSRNSTFLTNIHFLDWSLTWGTGKWSNTQYMSSTCSSMHSHTSAHTCTHPHTQRLAFKRRRHYLFSSSLKSLGSLTFFCTNILGYCFINTLCADRILVRLKREREKLL